jgi:hypothetical protein
MATLSQLLDDGRVERLKGHWITSVGDLVSALEADEASVGQLLNLPQPALKRLHERALKIVEPEIRRDVEEERDRSRHYGAWEPVEQ